MTTVLIKIAQVVLALSFLILIHEFGHFLFAKLFKTRVNKFYLFFNPKISLVKCKKIDGKLRWKFFSKNGGDWDECPNTEYGIGWLPLGGYCAIAGMIDETTKKEDLSEVPQPWEFRTKPAWQRFFIMFGGVLFNFILAIILYACILGTWGEEYLKTDDAIYGVAVNDLAQEVGFRNGDRILSIDGVPTDNIANLQADIVRSKASEAVVLRNGDTVRIAIDPVYLPAMLNTPGMFDVAFPFVVSEIPAESINKDAGLEVGDACRAVNEEPMFLVHDVRAALQQHKGDSITVTVQRGATEAAVALQVDTAGMIGVGLDVDATKYFNVTKHNYGLFSAIPAGAAKAWKTISNYFKELGLIFNPKTEAYKSVGSFITIGKIFPAAWDWYKFWTLTALFSIMLGALNILPIPGLDGGHILFLLFEMVTGRKPSDKFLDIAETVGMIFLVCLMILAFGNDIKGLFIH